MDISLRYIAGFLNSRAADERLSSIAAERDDVTFTRLAGTPAEAERTRLHGSPSISVEEVDVFGKPGSNVGLSCRWYLTPGGTRAPRRSSRCGR